MRLAIVGLSKTKYVTETAIEEARSVVGQTVILVDGCEAPPWTADRASRNEVQYLRADLGDPEASASVLRPYNCCAVVSITEFQMINAARIRSHLGISGEPVSVEESVVDKFATRTILSKNGLTNVAFALADRVNLRDTLREIGLPAIVKPRRLTGSIGVYLVESLEQVESVGTAYQTNPMIGSEEYLVESFIEGPEISVEGLVVGGEFYLYAMTDKRNSDRPNFIEIGHSLPSIHVDAASGVREYVSRVTQVLGIGTAPIHAEVKLSPVGRS